MATDETALPPHALKVLEDVAKRQGFKQPRFQVSPQSTNKGDNFVGVVHWIEITDESRNKDEADGLKVVLKFMPDAELRRRAYQAGDLFVIEDTMYSRVLPALADFLHQRIGDRGISKCPKGVLPNTPRCYGSRVIGDYEEGKDVIVLQDMRHLGYKMKNRLQGLDVAHVRLVLRKLAEFHAVSMAMAHLEPERFEPLRASLREVLFRKESFVAKNMQKAAAESVRAMTLQRYPEGSDGHRRAFKMMDNYLEEMGHLVEADPEGGNCIIHGDCWINNVLFKYHEGEDKPTELCFLDFQLSRYAPPVLDLLYVFYSCSEQSLRHQHGDYLLKDYHLHLTSALDKLLGGAGAGSRMYSWETMQRQLKQRGRYGLGMAAITLMVFLAEGEDEMLNMESGVTDSAELNKLMDIQSLPKNSYRQKRMSDVLEDMLMYGYM